MSARTRPNDRTLRLFSSAPGYPWEYWRFIVYYPDFYYPDYDFLPGGGGSIDVSEPLGECLTPPVLPNPCYWTYREVTP